MITQLWHWLTNRQTNTNSGSRENLPALQSDYGRADESMPDFEAKDEPGRELIHNETNEKVARLKGRWIEADNDAVIDVYRT
jgi:hypothetical protein